MKRGRPLSASERTKRKRTSWPLNFEQMSAKTGASMSREKKERNAHSFSRVAKGRVQSFPKFGRTATLPRSTPFLLKNCFLELSHFRHLKCFTICKSEFFFKKKKKRKKIRRKKKFWPSKILTIRV